MNISIKKVNINKEIEFYDGLNYLLNKYDKSTVMAWYWTPNYIKNGFPVIKKPKTDLEKDIKKISKNLENPREYNDDKINKFKNYINYVEKKFKFKDLTLNEKCALARYYLIGSLNNSSLSVSPDIKKKWKIDFELFGSFYNTQYEYCGLYSDIEERCTCDVFNFKLKNNMTILVNPPYTEEWINKSCEFVNKYLEKNKKTTIYLVIPVWNISNRKKLGLTIYNDIPMIDEMKKSKYLVSHKMENLDFYNGLTKLKVNLKDHVHIFHLTNK